MNNYSGTPGIIFTKTYPVNDNYAFWLILINIFRFSSLMNTAWSNQVAIISIIHQPYRVHYSEEIQKQIYVMAVMSRFNV